MDYSFTEIDFFVHIINSASKINDKEYNDLLDNCRKKIVEYENNNGNKQLLHEKLSKLHGHYGKKNEVEKVKFIEDILLMITNN